MKCAEKCGIARVALCGGGIISHYEALVVKNFLMLSAYSW